MNLISRRPWIFAVAYTSLSLAVEIVLIVGFRLNVPKDNAVIAPIVLTIPPVLAATFSGFRRSLRDFLTVAGLSAILTLLITVVVTRLSGVNTGLVEPIINRSIAGGLAAAVTNWASAKRGKEEHNGCSPTGHHHVAQPNAG